MKLYIFNILAIALAISAAGCSDSDNWTPGPADNAAGVRAYFDNPSKTSYVFDSESDAADQFIDVTLSRMDTSGAASFPLILSSETEGMPAQFTLTMV